MRAEIDLTKRKMELGAAGDNGGGGGGGGGGGDDSDGADATHSSKNSSSRSSNNNTRPVTPVHGSRDESGSDAGSVSGDSDASSASLSSPKMDVILDVSSSSSSSAAANGANSRVLMNVPHCTLITPAKKFVGTLVVSTTHLTFTGRLEVPADPTNEFRNRSDAEQALVDRRINEAKANAKVGIFVRFTRTRSVIICFYVALFHVVLSQHA
jgi:hypothetical protein